MKEILVLLIVLINLVLGCMMYIWSPVTSVFSVIYYVALYFNCAVIVSIIYQIIVRYVHGTSSHC